MWETPSAGTVRQADQARAALNAAIAEINPFMQKARAMSAKVAAAGVTLKVPPA
jgi:hypothetical protein